MATLEEAIDLAVTELDRPDAVDLARRKAIAALQICHGAHRFTKDLVAGSDITINASGITTVALPSKFRTIQTIVAFDGDGNELQVVAKQKVLGMLTEQFDAIPPLQYLIAGGSCTIYTASYAGIDHCKLYYYELPEVTVDPDTARVSSTSWILTDYEQLYIDCLVWQVAKSLGLKDKVADYLESFKFSLGQIIQANPVY